MRDNVRTYPGLGALKINKMNLPLSIKVQTVLNHIFGDAFLDPEPASSAAL